MTAIIKQISGVRPHGDNLSIVSVDGMEVVANRKDDGSFRWTEGEVCVYVSEGSIIPDDVLEERGYWDEERGCGILEGKKRNRVKMRRFAGHESRGLLFKIGHDLAVRATTSEKPYFVIRESLPNDSDSVMVTLGDDVSEFLGITEHQA